MEGDGEQATGDGCGHETMQADTKRLRTFAWSDVARDALVYSETSELCLEMEGQSCGVGKQAAGKALEGRRDVETDVGPAGSPAGWARGCTLARLAPG